MQHFSIWPLEVISYNQMDAMGETRGSVSWPTWGIEDQTTDFLTHSLILCVRLFMGL